MAVCSTVDCMIARSCEILEAAIAANSYRFPRLPATTDTIMSPAPTKPPAHHPSQTDKHRHPLIPAKRWARRPLLKFQYGKYPHAFAILALLTSAILLLAAWVSTAFIGSQSPSNSLADAPWLFLVHKPFSVDGKPLDDAAVKAIPRYGISAFKICRWSMLPQDLLANGTCVGAPWVMTGSLEGIDGGEPLGLSTSVHASWSTHIVRQIVN